MGTGDEVNSVKESLDATTSALGQRYSAWKSAEKEKNKLKEKFFDAITGRLEQEVRASIIDTVIAKDSQEAAIRAQEKHPQFRCTLAEFIDDDRWKVILEEDPSLMSYVYVNVNDGMVYGRQMVQGQQMLDDERLREHEPELWEAITELPTERVMKPLEELNESQLAALQKYVYSGRPTVKLSAPRKATSEELESQ